MSGPIRIGVLIDEILQRYDQITERFSDEELYYLAGTSKRFYRYKLIKRLQATGISARELRAGVEEISTEN